MTMGGTSHPVLPGLMLPELRHTQLQRLFTTGFDLGEDYLREVLSLPREELIADLLAVIRWRVDNAGALRKAAGNGDLEPDNMCFLSHALFFLGEIRATEELTEVLELLGMEQDADLLVGDEGGSGLWQAYYALGRQEPELLYRFAAGTADPTYRTLAVEALGQLALHEPVWRDPVAGWMQDLLRAFLQVDSREEVFEPATATVLVLCDLRVRESLDLIREVLEVGRANRGLCGGPEEVARRMDASLLQFVKMELKDLPSLYLALSTADTDAPFSPEDASTQLDLRSGRPERAGKTGKTKQRTIRPKASSPYPKVGRNDPCPCGSGQKYKKCHGK